MSVNVSTDQARSFDEAYSLAGVLVDIDAAADVRAVQPHALEGSPEFDTEGINQKVLTTNITVLTADMPALTIDSTVTLHSTVFRIIGIEAEGKVCKTLELESP